MEDLNSPVAYIEVNNSLDSFIAKAHFSNSFKDIAERFYIIYHMLSRRYFDARNMSVNAVKYEITFISSNLEISPLKFVGVIQDADDLLSFLRVMKINLMDFINVFLEFMKASKILRLLYAYELSTKETITKYPNLANTIIQDCLNDFLKFFHDKIVYYEKVLRLDSYDQFIHLKDPDRIEDVKLYNLNENEFNQIVDFFSTLVLYGQHSEVKEELANIFSGRPRLDYLTLRGQKNQIADIFYQLHKNEKVDAKNIVTYKYWINARFRIASEGKIDILRPTLDEVFKGKGVVTKKKRPTLPEFLKYHIVKKK
ncbi:hypothetical protein [Pedobacter punctiformis]|uniref:Uncharacterized protein n=1 Tax=Pedobacter punctiformis TaxID=3004097 RepID=A0ABT4LD70_9SPHI|nr:hypothetical protein [Pedobacter sp. HCMS5-2]MCZ4245839.1 hypothetical protein [Pedobacter sp. HCMS5-2]